MRTRILDATLASVSWSGVDRLSITDVSRLAEISRQSLYRYFANKEDLLNGLIRHLQHLVEDRVEKEVQASADLEARLVAMSSADVDSSGGKKSDALLHAEPALMLEHLNTFPSRIADIMEKALEPFLDEAERRSNVRIDRKLLAETIERIRISLFLVPRNTGSDFAVRVTRAIVRGALANPAEWAIREERAP
jgi:AcrR family transcriptional regulator